MTDPELRQRVIRAQDYALSRARLSGRREAFEELARWAQHVAPGSYDDEQLLAAVVERCRVEAAYVTQEIRRLAAEAGITVDATTEES